MTKITLRNTVETLTHGGTPSRDKADFWTGSIPWITGADFANQKVAFVRRYITPKALLSSATGLVRKGDLLVVTRTGVGKVGIAPFDVAISQDITGVHFRPALASTEFMYYLLQYKADYFLTLNQGTSINGIKREDLLSLEITLLPPKQQVKIAEVLSTIDRAIEQTDALIAKYQHVKKGLMQDLLTRGIDETGNLRSLKTHQFKDSSLGRIPVEWEVTSLESVGQWFSGGTPNKSNPAFWGGPISWASPKDMKTEYLDQTVDHITELGAKSGTRLIPRNSILVVVRGMILLNDFPACLTMKSMAINQDVKAIVPNPEFEPEFVLFWLLSSKNKIMRLATEATHGTKRIDMKDLHSVAFPKPTPDEQRRIIEVLKSFQRDGSSALERKFKLARMKRGLMQNLLTGKVDVTPLLINENFS